MSKTYQRPVELSAKYNDNCSLLAVMATINLVDGVRGDVLELLRYKGLKTTTTTIRQKR